MSFPGTRVRLRRPPAKRRCPVCGAELMFVGTAVYCPLAAEHPTVREDENVAIVEAAGQPLLTDDVPAAGSGA